ncbi:MAG: hypothetical protein ACM3VT_05060 [Solirubrobacterales bacterium]
MSIKATIDAIATRWKDFRGETACGRGVQARLETTGLASETCRPGETPQADMPQKINYFEFSCCYHTSGLCLIGVKDIQ